MKKWILIISLLLILSVGASAFVYINARAPLKSAEQYAEKRAKTEANLISTDQFYMYNGSASYYVIVGEQKNKEKIVVWIPEDKKQKIVTKKLSEGVSEREAIAKLLKEESPKKILGSRLGMEKSLPVWELAYLDRNSKLNYYYIHFDSGKWWRKIENL
ncbi:DUF5590 domain-containing protein [Lederbergia citrea]|uniref:DUF5590 domain-containing protein n=1 Tax=Lederbergia citrea TaxID=2833581 RepID=A0A942UNL0_9BACI|nr:DUF5590 domain-containing protein [Lederbergia citrea]MBS4176591.1 DUF5590 domain-containing protein [Lederbergia citrea]MBS4203152.1 DUF5590 domain-containing protein [Lederbergia citrea]MBS4222176.1 DUF5590 domain-containing protein [Lederbergia citrea]